MSVVSYRIYCDDCENETVLKEREFESSLWTVSSGHNHSGTCPECNPLVSDEDMQDEREGQADDDEPVAFEDIAGIGSSVAESLQNSGIVTRGDVRLASDAKLESIRGVGSGKVETIREHVQNA